MATESARGGTHGDQPARGKKRAARIAWADGSGTPVVFANQLSISRATGTEFFITFGELSPPPFIEPSDLPDVLLIRPVARVVVTPEAYKSMVETFLASLERSDGEPESVEGEKP